MPGGRVRVLAADGQPLYRDAVARAIRERPELELVGEARDAIGAKRPDVAIIGGTLGTPNGEQVLNAVTRDGLHTRVVMIAARPEPERVYAALGGGASGYLTTVADARELCDAITAVARGRTVLSPDLQDCVAGEIRLRTPRDRPAMTAREQETLALIAEGMSAPQI